METNLQTKTGLFRQEAPISEDIKPNFQFSEVKDTKVLCAPYTDLQSITHWPEESLKKNAKKSKLTYIMQDITYEKFLEGA